jgi:hypothetical protein
MLSPEGSACSWISLRFALAEGVMTQPLARPCSRCGVSRPRGAFGRSAQTRDGLRSWCRPCERAWARERRARLVAAGRCPYHPGRFAMRGYRRCEACVEASRRYVAAHQARRRVLGQCQRCSKPARPGGGFCATCARKKSEADRARAEAVRARATRRRRRREG